MHGNGLSVQTLIIASLASAAAALLTSLFWESGTVFSAAFTPLIVTLISEALKKPAATISQVRVRRQQTVATAGAGGSRGAPTPEPLAGSSTADRPAGPGYRRFGGRRINLKVVLVTAGLAFVIAAAVITLPELATGQSVAGESGRTTLGGGSSDEPETRESGDTPAERQAADPSPERSTPSETSPRQSVPPAEQSAPTDSTKTTTAPETQTQQQQKMQRSAPAPGGGQAPPSQSSPSDSSP